MIQTIILQRLKMWQKANRLTKMQHQVPLLNPKATSRIIRVAHASSKSFRSCSSQSKTISQVINLRQQSLTKTLAMHQLPSSERLAKCPTLTPTYRNGITSSFRRSDPIQTVCIPYRPKSRQSSSKLSNNKQVSLGCR